MKEFSQWSIRTQLSVSLGVGLAIIMIVSLYINFQVVEKRIKTESQLYAKNVAIKIISGLTETLKEVESTTSLLAVVAKYNRHSESELSDLLKNIVTQNAQIYGATIAVEPQYSTNKMGFAPYYHHVSEKSDLNNLDQTPVVDQGELKNESVIYANLATKEYNYSNQQWYSKAKSFREPVWSEPYFDQGGGNLYMITYTQPIFVDNLFYGVVTGDLEVGHVHQKIQNAETIDGAHALLLDKDLNAISSIKSEHFMKPITSLLGTTKKYDLWRETLSLVSEQKEGIATLPCLHQAGSCFVVYLTLPVNNWPLLIIFPKREMYAELYAYTFKYLILSAFLIIMLCVFVVWLTKRLTRSLVLITQAASYLGQGKDFKKIPYLHSSEEAISLTTAFNKVQIDIATYIDRLQKETATINRLDGELSAATQIQMDMLPGNGLAVLNTPRLSLWAQVVPAKSIGGDLYHYHINENKITFIIGDVSDKGVSAALFMARTVSLFKQYDEHEQPNEILQRLNNQLEENNDACMFVTAVIGELDLSTGLLTYSNAGHPPPVLKSESGLVELVQDSGPALGLIRNAEYSVSSLTMRVNSQIIVYTDGVDEAFNSQGEIYGVERLITHIASLKMSRSQTIGESIFESVAQFRQERVQSDDIAIMVIEYMPKFTFLFEDIKWLTEIGTLNIKAESKSLKLIMLHIEDYLASYIDKDRTDFHTIRLLLEEMFENAINHGELSLDTIEFYFAYDNGRLLVEMSDSGKPFNPLEQSCKAELGLNSTDVEIGGLGVHLIQSLSLRQRYRRIGDKNHLCILIDCNPSNH